MNRSHFAKRQRSNSAAADVIGPDQILNRPGFSIVIDGFVARQTNPAAPTRSGTVRATVTDATNSSFVIAGHEGDGAAAGIANAIVSCEKVTPHIFAEGAPVNITINGSGESVTVGYSVDYHYEPTPTGFTSTQPVI